MKVELCRKTKETYVKVKLDVYGTGKVNINTDVGYINHMLELLGVWANFDLDLEAKGDIEVDVHHTLEDIGLTLGEAFSSSLKDKKGIARVGWAKVPMDEALCEAVVDISGRPYLVYKNSEILPPMIFGEEKDVWREFFKSFCFRAKINLHILFHYGQNGHHLVESCFKAVGIALKNAITKERDYLLSTKGVIE